jgi:hypothetical protein
MTPKLRSLETFPLESDNYLSSPRVTLSDDEVAEGKTNLDKTAVTSLKSFLLDNLVSDIPKEAKT